MKNLLTKLKHFLFHNRFLTAWQRAKLQFPEAKHVITEGFQANGITYYCFDDTFNLPFQRGTQAIMVYEELRMKVDYELLKSFTAAIDKLLSGNKIGLPQFYEIKRMNDIMRERLTWVVDTDLVYKLAAVIYFDNTENPYRYDAKYAAAKIERWKKMEGINDFFLREPMQKLIPFLNGSDLNFQQYSQAQEALKQSMQQIISTNLLGQSGGNSSDKPSASSAMEMPPKQQ